METKQLNLYGKKKRKRKKNLLSQTNHAIFVGKNSDLC
jgi:hypothetical protein